MILALSPLHVHNNNLFYNKAFLNKRDTPSSNYSSSLQFSKVTLYFTSRIEILLRLCGLVYLFYLKIVCCLFTEKRAEPFFYGGCPVVVRRIHSFVIYNHTTTCILYIMHMIPYILLKRLF